MQNNAETLSTPFINTFTPFAAGALAGSVFTKVYEELREYTRFRLRK